MKRKDSLMIWDIVNDFSLTNDENHSILFKNTCIEVWLIDQKCNTYLMYTFWWVWTYTHTHDIMTTIKIVNISLTSKRFPYHFAFFKTILNSIFRSIVKLRGRYKISHMFPNITHPFTLNILQQSGTFVTTEKPTVIYYNLSKPIVCIMVQSSCYTFYGFRKTCNGMYPSL